MSEAYEAGEGINRNIVECKGAARNRTTCFAFVLIETLWNVKESIPCRGEYLGDSINRNIVECKGATLPSAAIPYPSY